MFYIRSPGKRLLAARVHFGTSCSGISTSHVHCNAPQNKEHLIFTTLTQSVCYAMWPPDGGLVPV